MVSIAPPSGPPRRPWYLVAGLVVALMLAVGGCFDGCKTISFYRENIDTRYLEAQIPASEHLKLRAAVERLVGSFEHAKRRQFPLGAARFVLGFAMIAFVVRAMGRNEGARSGLVQVASVQAATVVLGYFLARDVEEAEVRFQREFQQMQLVGKPGVSVPPEQIFKLVVPMRTALHTVMTALVVLSLSSRRSRASYKYAADRET